MADKDALLNEFRKKLKKIEEEDEGFFGENPSPGQEALAGLLAEATFCGISLENFFKISNKSSHIKIPDCTYIDFYQYVLDFPLPLEEKKRALVKYFPGKFGNEGESPALKMDETTLNGTFNGIRAYAQGIFKKRIKQ